MDMLRWRKWSLLFLLTILLFSSNLIYAQGSHQLGLAVIDLSVEYGIDAALSVPISQRLRQELQTTGVYNVLDRNVMLEKLNGTGLDPASINTPEKAAEAGRNAGVERVLLGSFSKIGNMITVSVQVVNSLSGQVVDTKTIDCNCPIEDVMTTTLTQLAGQLAGKPVAAPQPLATTTQPTQVVAEPEPVATPQPTYTAPKKQLNTGTTRNSGSYFGVQLGIDSSNLAVNEGQEYFKPRTGLALGFAAEFNADQQVSIRAEIWTHSRGTSIEPDSSETTDWKITYYSMPLLVKFNFSDKPTYFSVYGGIELGYVVLMELGDLKSSDPDDDEALRDFFEFTDFGLTFGATMHVDHLYFDLRYYHGLKNILKDIDDLQGAVQEDDAFRKNRTVSITVGYHFFFPR